MAPRMRCRAILVAVALLAAHGAHCADAIPDHLAGMSADLIRGVDARLADPSGGSSEKSALTEARNLLRKGGAYNWSSQSIVLNGAAEKTGAALDLDPSSRDDRAVLQELLEQDDPEERRARIGKLLKDRGRPADEAALNEALTRFDAAREESIGDLPRVHRQNVGETGKLTILWRPEENAVQMILSGRSGDSPTGKEYQTVLTGDATPRPGTDGKDLRMKVEPEENGARGYSGEELERLRASIFGKWNGPEGDLWEIARGGGAKPEEAAAGGARQELEQARRELADLKQQKLFVWKDPAGKVVRQNRFERLAEPWVYQGEEFAEADGGQRAGELEQRIKALEERAAAKLPVDEHDPLGLRAMDLDEPQAVQITVTYANGHRFTYRRAWFDGFRITADRTLTSTADIIDLPQDVIAQLLASWSPPEWIELEALPGADASSIRLEGLRWRVHVTYSPPFMGIGGNTVEGIHTPYSKPLALTQGGVKSAEGAKKDELL